MIFNIRDQVGPVERIASSHVCAICVLKVSCVCLSLIKFKEEFECDIPVIGMLRVKIS